jgi:hypothetical protein
VLALGFIIYIFNISLYLQVMSYHFTCTIRTLTNWAWWRMPKIPALGKLRQKDHEFETSLRYMVIPQLKQTNKNRGRRIEVGGHPGQS